VQGLRKQQGWVGLLALLFVVVVIALMARTALKEYGLYPGSGTRASATARDDRARDAEIDKAAAEGVAPSPQNAMDRVRRLGDTVKQKATELDERMDKAAR
jgi:hypothetical protein